MIKTLLFTAAGITALALFILAGHLDHHDAIDAQSHYCEMRQIHIESNGEYGWPKMNNYSTCAIERYAP